MGNAMHEFCQWHNKLMNSFKELEIGWFFLGMV